MNEHAKARSIGIFVSTALLVLVIGVALLSSGSLFKKTDHFVVVFDRSIKGLNIGSTVTAQGVPIGQVVDIQVVFSEKLGKIVLPVILEIKEIGLKTSRGVNVDMFTPAHEAIVDHIQARLVPRSLVTGQLMIELEVNQSSVGRTIDIKTDITQIPLLPSQFDEAGAAIEGILQDIRAVDFRAIGGEFSRLLTNINQLLESESLDTLRAEMATASKELTTLLTQLNANLPETIEQFHSSMASVRDSSERFRQFSDRGVAVMPDVEKAVVQLSTTLEQAETTLKAYEGMVNSDSNLRYQAQQNLQQMEQTLQSTNELLENLQRHPESIIFGKSE
ncbi:MlaD family protein [Neiella marina]|uniref:MlaD family protein n=1 Tax=Neiella holothuriorum TaxID=2870530 RepID=A0ABS7EFP5_9GAMM|nr:MlaD family protein [Neiella holothuriorum]MBW8191177.1 MlaD family protein [Neiella holothuriorum]